MPATTPNPAKMKEGFSGGVQRDGWVQPTYLSMDLTSDQKDALRAFVERTEYKELLEYLTSRLQEGHSLSSKVSKKAVFVSLVGITAASGHLGFALTSRASTLEKAYFGLMFRDVEMLNGEWAKAESVVDDY